MDGRARWLPVLAVAALGIQVLVEWAARSAFGLDGVPVGLGLTTAVVLVALLFSLGAVEASIRGIHNATSTCGAVAHAAFGLPRLVVGPVAAAVVGLIAYFAVLGLWRPRGLRQAWAYMRTLE